MYAIDHLDGTYPDSWDTLIRATPDWLEPHLFVGSKPGVTPASDFQQMFNEAGHISFVWVGRGVTDSAGYGVMLAYEAPIASYKEGTWILTADGNVRKSCGDELRVLVQEAARRMSESLPGLPADQ